MVHVVIADDDQVIRGLVELIVLMLEWTFDSATNGTQALDMIERVLPDLVISDIAMPGMTGIQLLEAMKNNPTVANVPVALMSSVDREPEAREAGCTAFIAKPFTIEDLLELLPQLVPPDSLAPES